MLENKFLKWSKLLMEAWLIGKGFFKKKSAIAFNAAAE
jgi:hypothetical protein